MSRQKKIVEQIAKEISQRTGIEIAIHTVSLEPTSYSEGQFPIIRAQWEEELFRLFDAYAPNRNNSWRDYGKDFENDTFWVHLDYHFFDCSCGHKGEMFSDELLNAEHNKSCKYWWINKPNFLHKPSGYEIYWYKYPCREAHANQPKTLEEFNEIINDCINSIKPREQVSFQIG